MVGVVVGGGGGVVVVLWAGSVEESRAESKELSNVRVQGQDCRVSTCYPPGPTAQAIINPLCGATACHYSNTHTYMHTHIHMFSHSLMSMHTPAHALTHKGRLMSRVLHYTAQGVMYYRQTDVNTKKTMRRCFVCVFCIYTHTINAFLNLP